MNFLRTSHPLASHLCEKWSLKKNRWCFTSPSAPLMLVVPRNVEFARNCHTLATYCAALCELFLLEQHFCFIVTHSLWYSNSLFYMVFQGSQLLWAAGPPAGEAPRVHSLFQEQDYSARRWCPETGGHCGGGQNASWGKAEGLSSGGK